jgi:hypothetical protein
MRCARASTISGSRNLAHYHPPDYHVAEAIGDCMTNTQAIELTQPEKDLLAKIEIRERAWNDLDYQQRQSNGDLVCRLMDSLIARKAIPEPRLRFFNDPDYNIGAGRRSRYEGFEKNGTKGDKIFRHGHFLKYLRYFLFGADLPPGVIASFVGRVADCGTITSGDIEPLEKFARQQTREHGLAPKEAADEFYKLALDLNLSQSYAASIRKSVMTVRVTGAGEGRAPGRRPRRAP